MARLNKSDVLHVANLAKLTLSPKEVETYRKQLSSVVEYIGELGQVDTSDAEPTTQTTGLENVYRTDEVRSEQVLKQEDALSGTENTKNGYFKVPAILEEKGKG